MKRRDFLGNAFGALGALALPGTAALAAKPASALRLTLIHTNDIHSHLEPRAPGGEYGGMGGAAARSTLFRRIRETFDHSLLFDSGDIMQGTPYFNLFEGEPEIRVMNAQGYAASAIGNHDFDAGIERMADLAKNRMWFPFLCANYDFSNTPMKGLARESMIFEIEGAKIGVLGVGIKLEGLVPKDWYGDTVYLDPIGEARRVAQRLRFDEKCDFVVCLSHVNLYEQKDEKSWTQEPGDRDLIAEVPEIDVILGGHNHILFERPEIYPKSDGKGYIQQTGWAGTHVGVLHFDVYGPNRTELAWGGPVGVHG